MMDCKKYFKIASELYEKYLKIWEEFCNIESPTADKAAVDEAGEYICKSARELGFKVEKKPMDASGDVICITFGDDKEKAPLCISAHIDTVHPKGAFGYPPVKVEGEKIYGPGVLDDKGGAVAGLMAMEALSKGGFCRRPVMLLLQTDEEESSMQSGKATINYICERAKDAVAFLNLEGYTPGEGCIRRKGIVSYEFTVEGKAEHASNCAHSGANAIIDGAQRMLVLDKIKDDNGITCNVATVSGGTVSNIVPDLCRFEAEFRFDTAKDKEWIAEFVKNTAAESFVEGCRCTVRETKSRLAMEECEKNRELLEKINGAFEKCAMERLSPSARKGGSDAAEVTYAGIPCVDSLGVTGGKIHTLDEYAYTESLLAAAKRVIAAACFI